jgi:hypothetical protein
MAPNPVLYQRLQFGKQGSFGTPVAATRRMAAIVGSYSPVVEVATYRPAGSRLTSVAALNKEHSEITIEETPLTYNEVIYLLGLSARYGNADRQRHKYAVCAHLRRDTRSFRGAPNVHGGTR